jgi:hypothetical protein
MTRPLIRYTVGAVGPSGWEILSESVRLVKKVYPEFDIAVCHNNLPPGRAAMLDAMAVTTVRQDDLPQPANFVTTGDSRVRDFYWKLTPPRLRPDAHELWVDNDIVIRARLPGIDRWLAGDTGIIGTGFNHDYGRFAPQLADGPAYCAGLFGLPPWFDFAAEIRRLCAGLPVKGFDEQGLVALVVSGTKDHIVLPQGELSLLSERWTPPFNMQFPPALHFARANRFARHKCWRHYKLACSP